MTYQQYDSLDYAQVAAEVLTYWNQNQVFEQSVALRDGQPDAPTNRFTFYEGPPSANGTPGIHHVMARTIKDIFCRYKTLRGFQVERKGGWDTHGLPIELQVEKELGITKDDIGKTISVEEYNRRCRETVMRFTDQWNDLTQKMGYWVDLDNPYITYKNQYIESVWSLLRQLYDKNLLYKGYTIQPYSPKAGTGLSSHELNQPGTYKDVRDTTVVAQFKAKLTGKSAYLFDAAESDDVYILAWTTTPWTLPANSALTVGKDIDYVLVRTFNAYTYQLVNVVLAKALVSRWFAEKNRVENMYDPAFDAYLLSEHTASQPIPWAVVMDMKGEHLTDIEYEQLMPYVQPSTPAFRVILGDFVTTEDGTGIVHTSPTFGADDFRVAQVAGIPPIMVKDETGKDVPIVDKQGRFVAEITDFAGRYVKEEYYSDEDRSDPDFKATDVLIAIKLKEENKAFRVEKYEHPYPHCWRTDKPILYYPLDSWFIRTTAVKDRLVELNKTINWQPESTGTGRFGNWLENLVDWNLSRSRFWGTPLPIWRSESGEEVCVGSIKELVDLATTALESGKLSDEQHERNDKFVTVVAGSALDPSVSFDLHRPYVDEIYLISPNGQLMQRESDLIDVWFDSGAMPYAQWHYPFENKEVFERSFPADFISEGVDQTRGWFFTLHAIGVMLFDSVAFKNVVSTGLVLDKNGNKMSKRLGNAVDPFQTLAKYGPDATRWYMITNAEPWDNLKFNVDGIGEVQRRFFGTLFNTYNFFALYANLDGYSIDSTRATDWVSREQLPELDRWILSKLNTLIRDVTEQYESYNPTKAGRLVQDFVTDQLSNWYVRLSRRRFWAGGTSQGELSLDKRAAYQTLQQCLVTVSQLMSPIAPFFADWLHRNLTSGQQPDATNSVHLTNWYSVDEAAIDTDLERSMELAQEVSSLVHSLRKGHKLKVRQPLSRVLIPVLSSDTRRQIEHVAPIIMAEVNVKAVDFVDDASGILKKKVKPNFKALGPRFGKQMKDVAAAITAMTSDELKSLEQAGTLHLDPYTLQLSDVEILTEDIPGWLVASEDGLTVALDVTVTDELRREGIARDLVNRIQNLRKDQGFDVTDKIRIELEPTDALLVEAVQMNSDYIRQEVQAVSLDLISDLNGNATEIDMDEFRLRLKVVVA
ncbi:isoleucine--tRNA ligase [Spirosoma utsteinense]|uniref:Isoleucine--tRNA ligase n=1 Tax=Spirosoma utsteinense TaxID=2585773 RepID=A0ABR6WCJ2_9BACT|nr:isoleucine--tRNA ligase [Spirosoma utsteinense]MBC3786915.1 isoleucyl-tRNA synthetase [Spirosoma utsteinense]MBC3794294.1 isoleucyl-tRNA synthetase [Spirosoma utsteinense]